MPKKKEKKRISTDAESFVWDMYEDGPPNVRFSFI